MESWCELVSSYPDQPEPRDLARALHTANTLFSGDLAPYEIEWLVQTLFFKPIDVLNTIVTKKASEDWLKSISDSFKVISKLVGKYWNVLEKDYEAVVKLCMLPYDAQTKKDAILCLINILKNPGIDIGNAKRHIDALEGATTCKAPLALLVGNICRYCPEGVDQEYVRVWRIYLNMLQHQNKTDTVVNAVLQGIDGLFENFGRDLPMAEINDFYKDFSRKCAKMSKCIEPLLSILKSHAGLFQERLAEDQVLRLYLWEINSPNIKDALLAVYKVIFEIVSQDKMKNIINSEVQPRMNSDSSTVKHTALRIAFHAKIHHRVPILNIFRPDVLEFQIRHRSISYQEADLVSICLASQEGYVKSLLVTVIMYYDNIPVSLRQGIVVEGICGTAKDIRKATLTLLIELSRQDGGLSKFADLWRALLDSDTMARSVLEDTLNHIVFLYKSFLDAPVKDLDQILSLSAVLTFILSVSETDNSSQLCELLRPVLIDLASAICMCPTELLSVKYICIETFKQDSLLIALLSTFKKNKCYYEKLSLIQEIFNNDTVDTKLRIRGLSEMDSLMKTNMDLDNKRVAYIIKQISKLKSNKTASSVNDRILQRDVAIFIGEHGNMLAKENFSEELYSLELVNKINITIRNAADGKNYKIDLQRILQLALVHEDFEALYCLLSIITVNLRDRPEPGLQNLVWRVCHAIFRSGGSVDVSPALSFCASTSCVQLALQSIIEETNLVLRQHLCEGLEVMLLRDPGSETAEELLAVVADELLAMIDCPDEPNYDAGLDITRIFLNTLRENDSFSIKFLPKIIMLLSKKIQKELYKSATDIFIDKIDIFEEEIVKEIISGILKNILPNDNKLHLQYVLEILKRIIDLKDYEYSILIENTTQVENNHNFVNTLQIMALAKGIFDFNEDICTSVIVTEQIIDKIDESIYMFMEASDLQNILKFLNEYVVYLLDFNKEKTIKCISNLIENITLPSASIIKNELSVCIDTYKTILKELPQEIKNSYHKCCQSFNIEDITVELERVMKMSDLFGITDVSEEISDRIEALGVMVEIFELAIPGTEVWTRMVIDNYHRLRFTIATILLSVAEKSVTESEFENIIKDDQNFVLKYLSVYYERVLLSEQIVIETSLFVIFLKFYVNNYKNDEKYFTRIQEIVEKVWPSFEKSDFEVKLSLTSDILRLPKTLGLVSPVRWMISAITAQETSLDHKVKMVTLLPGGEEYSACYRHLAGTLPIHLSEMKGDHAAVLRALLDSLATTADMVLLDIIITLAAAEDTKGWWDDAIDACMASLADRREDTIYDAAYKTVKKRTGLGGCKRVFLPLLRHSTRIFCEDYIAKIIADILLTLKTGFKEPSNTELYRERVLSYAKAFYILQLVIEKVPSKSLESGVINAKAGSQDPWYLIKEVCICSMTLRNKVRCPENASPAVRDACLRLQCSAYNCLVAAICKRRPSQKQYSSVFDVGAWTKIVDPDVQYDFWPRGYWGDNKNRRRPSGADGQGTSGTSTASTFAGTVRTRIFMATLSENPLQYDMIPNDDEDEEELEEEEPAGYENHPLNAHGCLSALTVLLAHCTTLEHTEWLGKLAQGLTSELPVNAKWTLAQSICNLEEDFKPHAEVLTPALLELIVATPKIVGDRKLLNNLHLDILWTIIKWNIPELSNYTNLSVCVTYLISTCIEYRAQEAVSRRLLNTLNTLLQMYGTRMEVDWSELQKHCDDMPNTSAYLFPILQRVLKNNISISGLINNILTKFDARLWSSTSKLPEVFGLALSLEKRRKDDFLGKFWSILGNVKASNVAAYVKVLLYTQRAEQKCCNNQHFRIITDLASKVERPKCLTIMATYLDSCVEGTDCMEVLETIGLKELLDGDYMVEAMKVVAGALRFIDSNMKTDIVNKVVQNCRNASVAVRKQAYAVILKVYQGLVMVKDSHAAKRRALQGTPILDLMESPSDFHNKILMEVSRGVFDKDEEIHRMMRDGVEESLSKDMPIRFAELFYIIFYLSRGCSVEMAQCGYVFLELLFMEMKRQDGYTEVKLSEQPLPPSDANIGYVIYATTGVMMGQIQNLASPRREIDAQMAVSDIFDTLLQSAKENGQICQELCIKLMKCLQAPSSPRFDLDFVMARLLGDMLKEPPNSMTPFVLEASRILLDSINSIDGLKESLEVLKHKVSHAEALAYYNILIEDLNLRRDGRNLFNFSIKEESDDIVMKEDSQSFCIEGVTEIFGRLSNWDSLRVQDKKRIEEQLPPLMTEPGSLVTCLEDYFDRRHGDLDYSLWFNKMAGVYASSKLDKTMLQFKEKWLRDIQRWPLRDFVTSAVIEAIKWPTDGAVTACNIKSTDCLAEWAARLMLRSAYFADDPIISAACRRDELKLCIEANKRQLPHLALQCIERNKSSLLEEEALSWFQETVQARRLIALRELDTNKVQKALEATEREDKGTSIGVKKLILLLRKDLGVLTKPKLDEILASIDSSMTMGDRPPSTDQNGDSLKSVYDIAMYHYDEMWDSSDIHTQAQIISDMATLIDKKLNYNLAIDHNLLICILLNRLAQFDGLLSEETAKKILEQVSTILPYLDDYSINYIQSISAVFPAHIWTQYNIHREEPLGLCKEYLQLVCDPANTLAGYCAELFKDWNSHQTVLARITTKFESSHRGTDYISLNTIKKRLFGLEKSDTRDREKQLKNILTELKKKLVKPVLRLSQLSPELSKQNTLEGQRENLRRLLGLPPSVYVVKFSEQVQVFVDAIRRPCVLSAVLSNGTTKRYIIKSGEVLANDASVQRAIAVLPTLIKGQFRSYNVTTLSEDCALIEYLENYQRLRDVMGKKIDITKTRLANEMLVQSPSLALEQYNALCNKIPVYTLRSSIEERCTSMEQFLSQRSVFTDTVSSMTVINWLFGVGDRHLQNIMISKQDGGVCAVDMASVFQYGLREYVPARLTPNVLAVCDVKVLESRLQSMLICLKQSRRLYEAFIKVSFYWKGRDFNEMKYIKNILEGCMVSYQVTRDAILNSSARHKQGCINVLDSVFIDFKEKDIYSVEEQVSYLLQHCTDPKILSITPGGWEAWV